MVLHYINYSVFDCDNIGYPLNGDKMWGTYTEMFPVIIGIRHDSSHLQT